MARVRTICVFMELEMNSSIILHNCAEDIFKTAFRSIYKGFEYRKVHKKATFLRLERLEYRYIIDPQLLIYIVIPFLHLWLIRATVHFFEILGIL